MNFLVRYGNFFLFIILESIALYMVARYNKDNNMVYQSTANLITGVIYDNVSGIKQYFSMRDIADSLARENALLRSQLESAKYVSQVQRGTVSFPLDTSTIRPDTAQEKDVVQKFKYQAAEIINNSIARTENYMTINKGTLHGVKAGMGVISSDGIVGIVRNVTAHYAQVMSVLNKRQSISALIKRNRYFGSLVWRGGDSKIMTLESIPKHAEVIKGDSIMTSGFSDVFPGELYVGRVVDSRIENGSNFYTIDVLLNNDIANLKYVYIVENLMLEESQQLFNMSQKPTKKQTPQYVPQN